MALWGGRFSTARSELFRQVNDSLPFDAAMATQDIEGSIVWSRAIAKVGVLTAAEQAQLEACLRDLKQQVEAGEIDPLASNEEDIHSFVEAYLTEQLGDIGRKLHTGRSRNDQVATDFRLWTREHLQALRATLVNLMETLANQAAQHKDIILPGYTHLQRAQPVRFAHWALAYFEMAKRDLSRLDDCLNRLNSCPLGCGALAGTTYPVDRQEIAAQLGFDQPCVNSLDAVSDRDFVLEAMFVASTSMLHLSRMAEDLIFYNSGEAGFLQMGDNVTSGSSLMPQKKNPDAMELVRGKTGRILGALQGLMVTIKGLPLAYNKDMQEDKEGLFDALENWHICLAISAEVLSSLTLDAERCRTAAQQGFANATEFADYLVEKGIPFRTAHDICGQAVQFALSKGCALEDLSVAELKQFADCIEDDIYPFLDLDYVVNKRNILGGTGDTPVTAAISAAQQFVQQQG